MSWPGAFSSLFSDLRRRQRRINANGINAVHAITTSSRQIDDFLVIPRNFASQERLEIESFLGELK